MTILIFQIQVVCFQLFIALMENKHGQSVLFSCKTYKPYAIRVQFNVFLATVYA